MSDPWAALLLCFVSTVVNVGVQIATHRRMHGYMLSIVAGFAAGFAVLLTGEGLRLTHGKFQFVEGAVLTAGDLVLYACASFLYFGFVNVGESSIRMRILRELSKLPTAIPESTFLEAYNDKAILEVRLGRMVRNHQVTFEAGRYRLRSSALARIASMILGLKMLLLRRTSEFPFGAL